MKKILLVIVVILLIAGYLNRGVLVADANQYLYASPCDTPVTYHVGSVDPKFNLSNQEFLSDIQESGNIWSSAEGKNLFAYKPDGDVTINLIYDQRQQLNSQINQLDNKLKTDQQSLDPQIASYKQKEAAFRTKVANLNSEIDYWNQRGGAPPDVYNKLKSEQSSLQQEATSLQQEAAQLNQSTDEYNTKVGQLHQTVDTFNTALQYKPEEGVYIVDHGIRTIDIYFDNSQNELIHTLAHEMGHALGLGHNSNQTSIMYPQTTTAVTLSSDDKLALDNVCAKRSVVTIFVEKLSELAQSINQRSN